MEERKIQIEEETKIAGEKLKAAQEAEAKTILSLYLKEVKTHILSPKPFIGLTFEDPRMGFDQGKLIFNGQHIGNAQCILNMRFNKVNALPFVQSPITYLDYVIDQYYQHFLNPTTRIRDESKEKLLKAPVDRKVLSLGSKLPIPKKSLYYIIINFDE